MMAASSGCLCRAGLILGLKIWGLAMTKDPKEIELLPDAWERFERAVDTVAMSGPKHRVGKPKSFVSLANELSVLLRKPGIPFHILDSATRLIQHVDKCLFVKPQIDLADFAPEASVLLQPSDLFVRYVAAIRASNWPLVSVIEHEAIS